MSGEAEEDGSATGAIRVFRARIYFLKPDEGGRTRPIFSGYRPTLRLGPKGDDCEAFDSVVTLEGDGVALPGEERVARIKVWAPELPEGALKPDAPFEIAEVVRTVGRGMVIGQVEEPPSPD